MNLVQPIRDVNQIEQMKRVLLEQGKGKRNYLIFLGLIINDKTKE